MGYEALVRKSWKTGDFSISVRDADAREGTEDDKALSRRRAQREIGEIINRETADANCCLTVHREGVMKLAPFVKFREEKFGAVLFETRSEKVYTLSPTGAAVVREIIAGAESENLVERLKEKFEDAKGDLAQEAGDFLSQLKEKGLITE